MVPPVPPEAVMVALPQKVPPPETETAAGTELIVTDALPSEPQQPADERDLK